MPSYLPLRHRSAAQQSRITAGQTPANSPSRQSMRRFAGEWSLRREMLYIHR